MSSDKSDKFNLLTFGFEHESDELDGYKIIRWIRLIRGRFFYEHELNEYGDKNRKFVVS